MELISRFHAWMPLVRKQEGYETHKRSCFSSSPKFRFGKLEPGVTWERFSTSVKTESGSSATVFVAAIDQ